MSKMSTTEQHYRFECQKIFDLQTSIYSSKEVLESDEEETDEEYDSEIEDMGHYLEAMLTQNKTFEEIDYEREEEERLDFVKSLQGNNNKLQNGKCKESYVGKILKITRTFENEGKTYTRTEFVRQSEVIEAYVRIRTTKSDDFIRRLSLIGNHAENDNKALNKSKTWNKSKANSSLKLVNENTKSVKRVLNNSNKVINTNHLNNNNFSNCNHEQSLQSFNDENEGHVRVDGSKLRFSKKVIDDAIRIQMEEKQREMEEREALKTDFNNVEYSTRRRSQRCRIDPMVKLKDIFDKTILEARKLPEIIDNIDYFMAPVKEKEVPDYYLHIKNPMDLKTMREKIYDGMYSSRRQFLEDIQLIYSNSAEYNGIDDDITKDAKNLLEFCVKKFDDLDEELSRLENEINPILAKDDSYQLAFIFDSVIAVFKQVRDIEYFFDISLRSQYRRKATKVIDLNMIAKKSKEKKYRSIDEFMSDLKLLQQNTTQSYGSSHELSEIATNQILLIAQTTIDQFLDKFKTHFPNLFKNHSSLKSS
jgi:transcription initiation factor TFIID subunit 1